MHDFPLTIDKLEQALGKAKDLRIAVVGDLFLDRYLHIDRTLDEDSIETGETAYQVTRVIASPGAAGTVINNLSALGVGCILPVAFIGDDGEGYELLQALRRTAGVVTDHVVTTRERRTPTYTKPMHLHAGNEPVEGNRLDIRNRQGTPQTVIDSLKQEIRALWPTLDGVIILDQVGDPTTGVITDEMAHHLAELAQTDPGVVTLADSRERIGVFHHLALKPNQRETLRASGLPDNATDQQLEAAIQKLALKGAPVFCTRAEAGIILAEGNGKPLRRVRGVAVSGPIDPVGAGDSTSAGIVLGQTSGLDAAESAALGCLVASITVQKIGTTGTASPGELREALKLLN